MAAQAALYGGIAALQLAGGYFAAQNIKEAAKLNREIAEMNAEFAELDAYESELEGYSAEARYQAVIDNTLAEQDVIMKAQDIDTSYGSAASISEETRFVGELNKMQIEKQAQEQALGFKRQARDYRLGGAMGEADARTKAGQVMFQSVIGAAQTGLTGYKASK